ncbi:thiamine diphosphokinase [Clostridium sp. AM58-1XD]|uniref:thiamine diphosphokinase n=1 Tax=Clostridium sp. AM58-1XD TaxID=2292307 RepID=UPI000E4C48E4|nr:thiamine diphosphokinase [Clostridium sp. AM58-1XD]RGY99423.1 thiamine diphosphokinase [Clostridium sp. AM58-1XD]
MRTCLILTGGSLDMEFAQKYIGGRTFHKIIAVDAGLAKAHDLGLAVHAAVGDFDSLDQDTLENYRKKNGIEWDIHKPEKDETDTELAIYTALKSGCEEIVMLGAMGGRLDHTIGNLHLLYYCLEHGMAACMVDEKNRVSVLNKGRAFKKDSQWGKYISFLPLTYEVKGITLTGFKYPLYKKDIVIGPSLCISNEIEEEEALLEFTEGVLICVESRD